MAKQNQNERSFNGKRKDNNGLSKLSNKRTKSKRSFRGKPKEFEVNLPDRDVNKEDLKKYISKDNDPQWYMKNNVLATNAASMYFSTPSGYLPPVAISNGAVNNAAANSITSVPGICALDISSTIGVTNTQYSAANTLFRNQFAFLRYANNAQTVYEQQDLGMYQLAMDSIFQLYAHFMRAYGTMKLSEEVYNVYYADALLSAMGFNGAELRNNAAEFRYWINSMAERIKSLKVPNEIAYFTRHIWMMSGIYKDGESVKSQLYLFRPSIVYKFSEGEEEGPNYLKATKIQAQYNLPTTNTLSIWKTLFEDLVDAVMSSESARIISGDLLKAYGSESMYTVPFLDEEYRVVPEYSKEVLSQIENLNIAWVTGTVTETQLKAWDITQSTGIGSGYIIQNPTAFVTNFSKSSAPCLAYLCMSQVLNIHSDIISAADILVSTRLMCIGRQTASGYSIASAADGYTLSVALRSCGSEVVTGAFIYQYYNTGQNGVPANWTTSLGKKPVYQIVNTISTLTNSTFYSSPLSGLCSLQQFDWHFPARLVNANEDQTTSGNLQINYIFDDTRDIENPCWLSEQQIVNLNDACLLSLFDSPSTQQTPKLR